MGFHQGLTSDTGPDAFDTPLPAYAGSTLQVLCARLVMG